MDKVKFHGMSWIFFIVWNQCNMSGEKAATNIHALIYPLLLIRGGSRISGKGVRMYKGMGVHFADFISFFFNIP